MSSAWKDRIVISVLFLLTFGLAGYWIVTNPQRPLPDPTLYEGIGANLAEGNGFSYDVKTPYRAELTRTPFLPALISVLYRVIGRQPEAVLWMNASFIAFSIVVAYFVILRVFRDRRVAIVGCLLAALTPPVTGSANNILTEPAAMLQISSLTLLLLTWHERKTSRHAWAIAGAIGLLLASTVLNRSSMTPMALVAGVYVAVSAVLRRFRNVSAWVSVVVLVVTLGTPVLMWSARNASQGLSFSPAPIGLYASRVFDMDRYKEHLLRPGEKLPRVNVIYFKHWLRRYSPDKIKDLEAKNKAWFEEWTSEHSDRVYKSMPYRFVGLFSFFRNSIYPPWPGHKDREMREVMRWISRTLWLFSLAGLIIAFRNRAARWMWLGGVVPLVVVHMLTVCHSRYMFPLLPLLMPYGVVPFVWIWDSARRRLSANRT